MKKKFLSLLCMSVALFVTVQGCGKGGDDPLDSFSTSGNFYDVQDTYTPVEEEEVVVIEEDPVPTLTYLGTSDYEYLNVYELTDGDVTLDLYLPGNEATLGTTTNAEAQLHGVQVSYTIVQRTTNSIFYELSSVYQTEKLKLNALSSVSDMVVPESLSGDGWALQELDYVITVDGQQYNGYTYVKADEIEDGVIVVTCVTAQGQDADEFTEDVFNEVMDAVGLTVDMTQSADDNDEEVIDEDGNEVIIDESIGEYDTWDTQNMTGEDMAGLEG